MDHIKLISEKKNVSITVRFMPHLSLVGVLAIFLAKLGHVLWPGRIPSSQGTRWCGSDNIYFQLYSDNDE